MRFGTKVTVMEHDSVSWRCLRCITHRQAENLRNVAADHNTTVHDFLTVPLSGDGGLGPSKEVVDTFCDYLEALHLEDKKKAAECLKVLNSAHADAIATEKPVTRIDNFKFFFCLNS